MACGCKDTLSWPVLLPHSLRPPASPVPPLVEAFSLGPSWAVTGQAGWWPRGGAGCTVQVSVRFARRRNRPTTPFSEGVALSEGRPQSLGDSGQGPHWGVGGQGPRAVTQSPSNRASRSTDGSLTSLSGIRDLPLGSPPQFTWSPHRLGDAGRRRQSGCTCQARDTPRPIHPSPPHLRPGPPAGPQLPPALLWRPPGTAVVLHSQTPGEVTARAPLGPGSGGTAALAPASTWAGSEF